MAIDHNKEKLTEALGVDHKMIDACFDHLSRLAEDESFAMTPSQSIEEFAKQFKKEFWGEGTNLSEYELAMIVAGFKLGEFIEHQRACKVVTELKMSLDLARMALTTMHKINELQKKNEG